MFCQSSDITSRTHGWTTDGIKFCCMRGTVVTRMYRRLVEFHVWAEERDERNDGAATREKSRQKVLSTTLRILTSRALVTACLVLYCATSPVVDLFDHQSSSVSWNTLTVGNSSFKAAKRVFVLFCFALWNSVVACSFVVALVGALFIVYCTTLDDSCILPFKVLLLPSLAR